MYNLQQVLSLGSSSASADEEAVVALMYDGTKAFWRHDRSVRFLLFEHKVMSSSVICVEVVAHLTSEGREEAPPLYLSYSKIFDQLRLKQNILRAGSEGSAHAKDLVSKYIFSRISMVNHIPSEGDKGESFEIEMVPLADDDTSDGDVSFEGERILGQLPPMEGIKVTDRTRALAQPTDRMLEWGRKVGLFQQETVLMQSAAKRASSHSRAASAALDKSLLIFQHKLHPEDRPGVPLPRRRWCKAIRKVLRQIQVKKNTLFLLERSARLFPLGLSDELDRSSKRPSRKGSDTVPPLMVQFMTLPSFLNVRKARGMSLFKNGSSEESLDINLKRGSSNLSLSPTPRTGRKDPGNVKLTGSIRQSDVETPPYRRTSDQPQRSIDSKGSSNNLSGLAKEGDSLSMRKRELDSQSFRRRSDQHQRPYSNLADSNTSNLTNNLTSNPTSSLTNNMSGIVREREPETPSFRQRRSNLDSVSPSRGASASSPKGFQVAQKQVSLKMKAASAPVSPCRSPSNSTDFLVQLQEEDISPSVLQEAVHMINLGPNPDPSPTPDMRPPHCESSVKTGRVHLTQIAEATTRESFCEPSPRGGGGSMRKSFIGGIGGLLPDLSHFLPILSLKAKENKAPGDLTTLLKVDEEKDKEKEKDKDMEKDKEKEKEREKEATYVALISPRASGSKSPRFLLESLGAQSNSRMNGVST